MEHKAFEHGSAQEVAEAHRVTRQKKTGRKVQYFAYMETWITSRSVWKVDTLNGVIKHGMLENGPFMSEIPF